MWFAGNSSQVYRWNQISSLLLKTDFSVVCQDSNLKQQEL